MGRGAHANLFREKSRLLSSSDVQMVDLSSSESSGSMPNLDKLSSSPGKPSMSPGMMAMQDGSSEEKRYQSATLQEVPRDYDVPDADDGHTRI